MLQVPRQHTWAVLQAVVVPAAQSSPGPGDHSLLPAFRSWFSLVVSLLVDIDSLKSFHWYLGLSPGSNSSSTGPGAGGGLGLKYALGRPPCTGMSAVALSQQEGPTGSNKPRGPQVTGSLVTGVPAPAHPLWHKPRPVAPPLPTPALFCQLEPVKYKLEAHIDLSYKFKTVLSYLHVQSGTRAVDGFWKLGVQALLHV